MTPHGQMRTERQKMLDGEDVELIAAPADDRRYTMHYSRLCAVLIDCNTPDVDEAAAFWAAAQGRPIDREHPGTPGNYRMLETPPDEPIIQIQRVEHDGTSQW